MTFTLAGNDCSYTNPAVSVKNIPAIEIDSKVSETLRRNLQMLSESPRLGPESLRKTEISIHMLPLHSFYSGAAKVSSFFKVSRLHYHGKQSRILHSEKTSERNLQHHDSKDNSKKKKFLHSKDALIDSPSYVKLETKGKIDQLSSYVDVPLEMDEPLSQQTSLFANFRGRQLFGVQVRYESDDISLQQLIAITFHGLVGGSSAHDEVDSPKKSNKCTLVPLLPISEIVFWKQESTHKKTDRFFKWMSSLELLTIMNSFDNDRSLGDF